MISMIVAYGLNREIGKDNKLLWKIPEDMKKFVKHTKGKAIIVGRKTFESFGKPLPGRTHLVLTRNENYHYDHPAVKVFHSVDAILKYINDESIDEAVVCGGAKIYDLFFKFCSKLYLSEIQWHGEADTYLGHYDLSTFTCHHEEVFEKTNDTPKWLFKIYQKT